MAYIRQSVGLDHLVKFSEIDDVGREVKAALAGEDKVRKVYLGAYYEWDVHGTKWDDHSIAVFYCNNSALTDAEEKVVREICAAHKRESN